jgi:DNA-binding MurR/RpiR family transcriptional regulator
MVVRVNEYPYFNEVPMMLFNYERIKRLNDLEFNVYNCIVTLDSKVLGMKIRDLAIASHVSTTVVLNFCKKMDCEGWTAFKIKYKEELQKNKAYESNEPITQQLIEHLQMYAQDTQKQDQLNKIVNLIYHSRRVIFIGAGPSGILAKYAALHFTTMEKTAQHIDSPYYPISEDDYHDTIVIALSVSGETKSVIQRLTRFKSLNATLVSITNTDENTMSKLSDLSLSYFVPQEEFYISEKLDEIHVTATTQIPVMYIIELMAKKFRKKKVLEQKNSN